MKKQKIENEKRQKVLELEKQKILFMKMIDEKVDRFMNNNHETLTINSYNIYHPFYFNETRKEIETKYPRLNFIGGHNCDYFTIIISLK